MRNSHASSPARRLDDRCRSPRRRFCAGGRHGAAATAGLRAAGRLRAAAGGGGTATHDGPAPPGRRRGTSRAGRLLAVRTGRLGMVPVRRRTAAVLARLSLRLRLRLRLWLPRAALLGAVALLAQIVLVTTTAQSADSVVPPSKRNARPKPMAADARRSLCT